MRKLILAILVALPTGIAFGSPGPDPIGNETTIADETDKNKSDTPVASEGAEADKPFMAPPGYKAKSRGKKVVYCRKDTVSGTRFASETCYSEAQLKAQAEERAREAQELEQRRRICNSLEACGGG